MNFLFPTISGDPVHPCSPPAIGAVRTSSRTHKERHSGQTTGPEGVPWHADTDEFFLVLDGQLTIQMRDGDVVLRPRELFVVPRGVEHCPRAYAETAVLLFEPNSVVNTGDAGGELTAEVEPLT
jgi:mannose-6-phosphate isomerase-like protein (cupin superfamily)